MTSGTFNTLVGGNAGDALTTGSRNVAIGFGSLSLEDDHGRNVAVGHSTLASLNAGADGNNTAIGFEAGYAMTTGKFNTAIGGSSMGVGVVTGDDNTAIGSKSQLNVTSGCLFYTSPSPRD